ncbi:MAG: HAMP domain-containing sensor histidine kinase [Jatrophihabitans sp.]
MTSVLRLSARARIVGWSVLLLTLSMLVTTTATHLLLIRRSDATINTELSHEIDEFNSLPAPASASPVRARMVEAIDRVVSSSDILKFALIDGRLVAHSRNSDVKSSSADARTLMRLSNVKLPARGTISLEGQEMRYVAVSVRDRRVRSVGTFIAAIRIAPERAAVWAATRLEIEVGAGSLMLAFVLAWLAAGRVLRPIRQTTSLAQRITDKDLNERLPVQGHDELSHLATAFNAMLDRLRDTLAAQRRFLADAGHELRTPITIIQGNLDTLSAADAEDRDTLAVVADELERMTRLVNELLLLGSSDRPDFLRLGPTDLSLLAASLATKAQALGQLDWSLRSTLTGWAVLDAQRVTQAVMQLVANAVAHRVKESAAELVFSNDGEELSFSVIDHGSGVDAADRDQIFDRFARVDRLRDNSTGLGLSIVAAIATAHHGSIRVADTPGGGATFTLCLPYTCPGLIPEAATSSSNGTR